MVGVEEQRKADRGCTKAEAGSSTGDEQKHR